MRCQEHEFHGAGIMEVCAETYRDGTFRGTELVGCLTNFERCKFTDCTFTLNRCKFRECAFTRCKSLLAGGK